MAEDVIVLEQSKTKTLFILLASAAFVAMGIFVAEKGNSFGWLIVAFFGLGLIAGSVGLGPGAGQLRADDFGIELKTPFRPMRIPWRDINRFYVGYVGPARTKLIAIEYSKTSERMVAGRKISAAISGMEGALPNHFTCSAEEVCEILNNAKQRWQDGA